MILLDADAVSKLAHWDLLNDLSPLCGIPGTQAATLSSLRHRARKSCSKPDGRLFRDADAATRAVQYLELLPSLPEPDAEFIARVQHVPAIDPGEAVLLGTLAAQTSSILITGDKRAVVALAQAVPTESLTPLQGRIVIIEQVVLALLKAQGIDWLRARICPHRTLDKAIGIVMGTDCRAPAESVKAGLRSYIADCRSSAGPLLRTSRPFEESSHAERQ